MSLRDSKVLKHEFARTNIEKPLIVSCNWQEG